MNLLLRLCLRSKITIYSYLRMAHSKHRIINIFHYVHFPFRFLYVHNNIICIHLYLCACITSFKLIITSNRSFEYFIRRDINWSTHTDYCVTVKWKYIISNQPSIENDSKIKIKKKEIFNYFIGYFVLYN